MGKIIRLTALAATIAVLAGGCASLSLFSSKHDHYYGTEKTKRRLDALEKRIEALEPKEAGGTGPAAP